jgi:hypothetical protein
MAVQTVGIVPHVVVLQVLRQALRGRRTIAEEADQLFGCWTYDHGPSRLGLLGRVRCVTSGFWTTWRPALPLPPVKMILLVMTVSSVVGLGHARVPAAACGNHPLGSDARSRCAYTLITKASSRITPRMRIFRKLSIRT